MSALESQTPCCLLRILFSFSFFSFFFLLFHLLAEICAQFSFLETGAIECRMVFIRDRLCYSVIWPKITILQLFEITLNTAARQSAHCCCMQLVRLLPLHALDQLTPGKDKHADVTSPASDVTSASRRPLPKVHCYRQTSRTQTELVFFRNSRM